jgi:hypothetical protein
MLRIDGNDGPGSNSVAPLPYGANNCGPRQGARDNVGRAPLGTVARPTGVRAQVLRWLVGLSRRWKRALLLSADAPIIPACLWFALAPKHDSFAAGLEQPWRAYVIAALVGVTVLLLPSWAFTGP